MELPIVRHSKLFRLLTDVCLLFFYCALIYWLSAQTTIPTPHWFSHQDKLIHAGVFAVMGFLAWRCFKHMSLNPLGVAVLSLLFCSLYGIFDEFHQFFVPGRQSDAVDWLADTVGALMSILFLYKLHKNTEFG